MKKLSHTAWLIMLATFVCACASQVEVRHINNLSSVVTVGGDVATLWLPMEDIADEVQIEVQSTSGNSERFDVRLAQHKVDYYMPLSMEGVEALRVEGCSYANICWQHFRTKEPMEYKNEPRQQVHFSAERGWINDPNGLFYKDGVWHLYYQHNPYGTRWGNMSWGHATSTNLTTWQHHPTVLFPDELGAIFSGSAVVDSDNTAGFGKGAIVALYTSAGARQSQSIAYSLDGGESFEKYGCNPVLVSERFDFRDPKLFWHTPSEKWIMVLAAGNAVEIYSSKNLREWNFESRCGEEWGYHTGVWECPDLFELPYKGGTKWVLLCSLSIPERGGSSVQYFVGEFDGHTFRPEGAEQGSAKLLNYGRDYYATVSWSGVEDGRRVVVGWQNNWEYANDLPTRDYRGYMTLPQQLRLVECDGEPLLVAQPADEFMARCRSVYYQDSFEVDGDCSLRRHHKEMLPMVVECDIVNHSAQSVGIKLCNNKNECVDLCFDFGEGFFKVDRTGCGKEVFHTHFPSVSQAPLSSCSTQHLLFVVDSFSVECFTDVAALSNLVFPSEEFARMSFYAIDGSAEVRNLKISEMTKEDK